MRLRPSHGLALKALTIAATSAFVGCGVATSSSDGPTSDVITVDTGGVGGDSGDETGRDGAVEDSSDAGPIDDAAGDAEVGGDVDLRQLCGNGRVERGEACDDGNNFPGDGCNPICTSDERCGNGVVDVTEQCDDGNVLPDDGCDALCRNEEGCGNGVVEVGEQCDDGNVLNGDSCSSGCVREVFVAVDSDGDTIADFDEGSGFVDSDADGIPDSADLDSDNDGVPDAVEAGDVDMGTEPPDTDGDGRYDFRDLDSDGDTLLDALEGYDDVDGDGRPNFADLDSDADYVPDSDETARDTDADGIADFIDRDSDNDGILDEHELFADSDGDGRYNRLDTDSDNDGVADSTEAGDADLSTYPIDSDADGQPDYIDIDSDDDGLFDDAEAGCPGGSERRDADSDDDGYSDLAEVLVRSNPCSYTTPTAFREFTDFFFILPYGARDAAPLEFSSNILKADVHINIDSSGSMDGEIANVRSRMSSFIVPRIAAEVGDVGFGFSDYRDCTGYAFRLRQRITTSVTSVQSAINGLTDTDGGWEPSYSSLWHIGSGSSAGGCLDLPTFSAGSGVVPGVADGTIGGVGFRSGSFPVVIHVTDESSEDSRCGGCARTRDQAVSSLNAISAKMIGVVSESPPRDELRDIARRTGAVVPVCAWDGARPSGCGAGDCCTGVNGAGQGSESGTCPLVFSIQNNGSGLAESVVTGLVALVNTTTLDVTPRLRRDEPTFVATGVDTRCFIQSIIPNRAVGASSCTTSPTPVDIAPVDGVLDSYRNVTPGTALFFDVTAANECVEQTDEPQAFFAYIDVVGDGITVLDTQSVTIIVPARTEVVSTVP